jgi:hypothetical protein
MLVSKNIRYAAFYNTRLLGWPYKGVATALRALITFAHLDFEIKPSEYLRRLVTTKVFRKILGKHSSAVEYKMT